MALSGPRPVTRRVTWNRSSARRFKSMLYARVGAGFATAAEVGGAAAAASVRARRRLGVRAYMRLLETGVGIERDRGVWDGNLAGRVSVFHKPGSRCDPEHRRGIGRLPFLTQDAGLLPARLPFFRR